MLRSPIRLVAVVVGAAIFALGVVGAIAAVVDPGNSEAVLGVFAANLPQALLHLGIGAGLVLAALASLRTARFAAQLGGTLLLALGVAGLFLVDSAANVLALGPSDNLLHFTAAAILLTVGFGATRGAPSR